MFALLPIFCCLLLKHNHDKLISEIYDSQTFEFWIFCAATSYYPPRLPWEWCASFVFCSFSLCWDCCRDSINYCLLFCVHFVTNLSFIACSHLACRKTSSHSLMHEHLRSSKKNSSNTRFVLIQACMCAHTPTITYTHTYIHNLLFSFCIVNKACVHCNCHQNRSLLYCLYQVHANIIVQ